MTTGRGDARVMVLHPVGLDRHVWPDVLVPGAIALDFPGHGTAETTGQISMTGLAYRVVGHISEPVTLVGLSPRPSGLLWSVASHHREGTNSGAC